MPAPAPHMGQHVPAHNTWALACPPPSSPPSHPLLLQDPRFERIPCSHKGTYADDCICQRIATHRCYIVATCDRDLRRRIRKVRADKGGWEAECQCLTIMFMCRQLRVF